MNEQILNLRYEKLTALLQEKALGHVLLLNPSLGNIDMWLLGQEGLPTPAPFDRNSAYLYAADGTVTKLCQTTTHPTDRAQFPHFEDVDLSAVFQGNVGIVNPQFLKKNVRDYLSSAYPAFQFVDVTEEFYKVKAERSPEEIEMLKAAAGEYDKLFQAMALVLRPERLEKEVATELRQRIAWQGAESETPGFHTLVELTSAPDGADAASEPMLWPGRRLQVRDRVNVSLRGYFQNGWATALGRSYVLGEPSREALEHWTVAVEAQTLAASLAKPGATLREIEARVNAFLAEKGLPLLKTAWIHGIGTAVYEQPRNVDASADWPLKEGMTLAIGPEVQPEGKDPYRCLDVFVVTAEGAVRLSATSQEIRAL